MRGNGMVVNAVPYAMTSKLTDGIYNLINIELPSSHINDNVLNHNFPLYIYEFKFLYNIFLEKEIFINSI